MSSVDVARHRAVQPAPARGEAKRADIQALRAVAVLGVVVYHLFPSVLPGGFVGVDVFFVISGFLITSHLLQKPPAAPADFARFWSRRILRLLPPVGVVIVATLVGVLLLMSSGQWHQMAREGAASMLYVENWELISQATDYLKAHHAASPFQHFWSLSVEEQYYIGWPFLVALLALVGRRTRVATRGAFVVGFSVAALGSFAYGVWQTQHAPSVAYFSTWGRVWELAVGSLLAAIFPALRAQLSAPLRLVSLWVGIVAIAASYATITTSTPFPGTAALLPTLGAAFVILADDPPGRLNPRVLSHAAPVQMIGDTSYALYLWHWPLLTLLPVALGRSATVPERLALIVVAATLAWLSTNFLEAPVRGSRCLRTRLRRVYGLGVAISCTVLLVSAGITVHVDRQVAADQRAVAAAQHSAGWCLGAAAMDPSHHCAPATTLVTTPEFAKADVSSGIRECLNWPPYHATAISCARGDTVRPLGKIALFGNSHAGQWTEAISDIAQRHHWELDTYIVGACFSSVTPQTDVCNKITGNAIHQIERGHYDTVVLATYDVNPASTVAMYTKTIDAFRAAGAHVLVIRDTPAPWDPNNQPADCIAQHPSDWGACAGTPQKWISEDLLYQAARQMHSSDVSTVDLDRFLCTSTTCPAVIGGVIVLSDYNHMSKTFSRSLAPYLEPSIVKAMR